MIEQIENYLKSKPGQLVGISDLAEHVKQREGEVFVALLKLQESGEVAIYRVYVCPQKHQLSQDLNSCPVCNRAIPEEEIRSLIFARAIA